MLMNIRHTWNDQLSRIIKNGDRLISLWQILEYADDGIFFTDNIGVLEDLKPFRGRGVDNVPLQCKNRKKKKKPLCDLLIGTCDHTQLPRQQAYRLFCFVRQAAVRAQSEHMAIL